jgi:hypothetical protein
MTITLNSAPGVISRREVAQRMFPDLKNVSSAVARLRRWLKKDPNVLKVLYDAGYRDGSHWFTPKVSRVLERFFL